MHTKYQLAVLGNRKYAVKFQPPPPSEYAIITGTKVKYKYLYQTKENENREGWITAKDRADAYAKLRRQGIKPYRVVGDDPVKWQPWAVGATIVVLAVALAASLLAIRDTSRRPAGRQQLVGERSVISAGLASCWDGVFDTDLDRYLAAYAQPGWIAVPPELGEGAVAKFADDLARPVGYRDGDGPEVRLLKRIVAKMREEMKEYLAGGGTVKDYMEFLEERQDQERDLRNKAIDSVARAPESMRERALANVNVRLREMGLAEIR